MLPLSQPVINYRAHPAFCNLPVCETALDQQCEGWVRELDAIFDEAQQCAETGAFNLGQRYIERAGPISEAMLVALRAAPRQDSQTLNWLEVSIRQGLLRLKEEIELAKRRAESWQRHNLDEQPLARAYFQQGVTEFTLPAGTNQMWYEWAQPLCQHLRQQAQARPSSRQFAEIAQYSRLGRHMVQQLHEVGAWHLAEQIQGTALEVADLYLHYSHPQQTWYQGCYTDLGLGTSAQSYLHYDYLPGNQKLLFYLVPVLPENGPFCFIPGSHTWSRSMFQHIVGKELDRQHKALIKTESPRGYYRARFEDSGERRRFASLPSVFQVTSHFGDDLLPDTTAAQCYQVAEQSYLGTDTVVMFNGSRGAHRGGLCRSGERWAVQIGLETKPRRGWLNQIKHHASHLRRVLR